MNLSLSLSLSLVFRFNFSISRPSERRDWARRHAPRNPLYGKWYFSFNLTTSNARKRTNSGATNFPRSDTEKSQKLKEYHISFFFRFCFSFFFFSFISFSSFLLFFFFTRARTHRIRARTNRNRLVNYRGVLYFEINPIQLPILIKCVLGLIV